MRYRTLGRTQLQVSEVGIGGAQFGLTNYMGHWDADSQEAERATTATIHRALELGYNYFDTAPGYGNGRSEELVGRALKGHRDKVVIATKVSGGQWTPEAIRQSALASLRRLQVDVIDVIQFHGGWYHPQEVDVILRGGGLETMQQLKAEGLVRFIGFTAEGPSCGVEQLIATGAFDVMQVRYNLMFQHPSDFENNEGIIRQADAQGMGVVLMRTMTSGVFQRLMAHAFPQIDPLEVGRLLLNYVLSDPYIDVALTGVRDPYLVEANNALSDDVAARLDLDELHNRYVH
ncbi:MAG: aldo/keto reductase [Chloroflexi bacterium]|jgi:aryl-alcohol dehydrogenase-like predicted oxidoreductase|nr:aldo/keto reductase [Chloroflexota bacterium]